MSKTPVVSVALSLFSAHCLGQGRTPEFARTLTNNLGLQGRIMWVDATANIDRITTIEGVRDVVAHCKKANLNVIVLDVKPVSGQVLYKSKIAEHMTEWKGRKYGDFDVLEAFVSESHKAGIELAASLNVFAEGHKYFNIGLAYKKPEWQSTTYYVERNLVARDGSRLPIRAVNESEDATRSTVYSADYIQEPLAISGQKLAVAFDETMHVSGMIDPALLDSEPLTIPEDGGILSLENGAMDWASTHLKVGDATRFEALGKRIPVTRAPSEKVTAFVNPLNPEVRKYEIGLLKEVAQNYNVDAIVFDRMRYANVFNDYSDLTRHSFEQWLGKPVPNWPDDILKFESKPGDGWKKGFLFKPWLEFRARIIREFAREATEAIREVNPSVQFGAYVGSWFTEYYGVGVNWGSEKFPVKTTWSSPRYNEAGYVEFLDWLSTGCYYPIATKDQARQLKKEEGGTVEASAELSTIAVANATPVYAGLYALNYAAKPLEFARAISAAARNSQGVMLFDLSYIYDYGWWPIVEQAFQGPAIPPHRVPDMVSRLRAVQDFARNAQDARSSNVRLPSVPFQPGGG